MSIRDGGAVRERALGEDAPVARDLGEALDDLRIASEVPRVHEVRIELVALRESDGAGAIVAELVLDECEEPVARARCDLALIARDASEVRDARVLRIELSERADVTHRMGVRRERLLVDFSGRLARAVGS